MIFKKKGFKKEILISLEKGDLKSVEKLSRLAFEKEKDNEDLLAFISAVIFEKQIWSVANLLPEFVNRFPQSLHAIRIYFAHILVRQNKFDNSSTEARIYLRLVKDNNLLGKTENEIIKNSIGHGFLFLTSVYTEIGAKSYSKRALMIGEKFVSDYWRKIYNDEFKTIDNELGDNNVQLIDKKWEDFFKTGANANELFELCKKRGFEDLAKRVDLIESNFRFNNKYSVDEKEIFQLIFEDKGKFLLN